MKYDDPDNPIDGAVEESAPAKKKRRIKLLLEAVNLTVLIVLVALFMIYSVKEERGFVYRIIQDTPLETTCRRLIPYIWHQRGALSAKMLDAPLLPSEQRRVAPILERMERLRPTHVLMLKGGQPVFGKLMATEDSDEEKVLRIREFDGQSFTTRTVNQDTIIMRTPVVMPEVEMTPRDLRFLLAYDSLNPYLAPPYLVVSYSGFRKVHWLHLTLSSLDEEFRKAFAPVIQQEENGAESLRHICFLPDQSTFVEHAAYNNEAGLVNSVGFFAKSGNRLFLFDQGATYAHNAGSQRESHPLDMNVEATALRQLAVTRHEGAHLLSVILGVLPMSGHTPFWLEEGLAQYCESSPFHTPSPERLFLIRAAAEDGQLIPLETLLALDSAERSKLDDTQQRLAYAQAWHLVHTLMGNDYRPQFFGYLLSLQQHDAEAESDSLQNLMNKLQTTPSKLTQELMQQAATAEAAPAP